MMKTRSFLLTACIMLALAFTLSCSDDKGNDDPVFPVLPVGGDGSLNGTWQKMARNYTFEISGGKAVFKENSSIPDEDEIIEGTITYDGSSGSWTIEQGTIPFEYEVSGNILTISNASASFMVDFVAGLNGQWVKQQ